MATFYTNTEKNISFISSDAVHIFPCAFRGTSENDEETQSAIDPEARLSTERNFTNFKPTIDKRSYIVGWADGDTQNSGKLACVLGGYYIELRLNKSDIGTDKQWIYLETLTEVTLGEGHTTAIKNLQTESASNFFLDGIPTGETKEFFFGIGFKATEPEANIEYKLNLKNATKLASEQMPIGSNKIESEAIGTPITGKLINKGNTVILNGTKESDVSSTDLFDVGDSSGAVLKVLPGAINALKPINGVNLNGTSGQLSISESSETGGSVTVAANKDLTINETAIINSNGITINDRTINLTSGSIDLPINVTNNGAQIWCQIKETSGITNNWIPVSNEAGAKSSIVQTDADGNINAKIEGSISNAISDASGNNIQDTYAEANSLTWTDATSASADSTLSISNKAATPTVKTITIEKVRKAFEADKATNDGEGDNIRDTYASEIIYSNDTSKKEVSIGLCNPTGTSISSFKLSYAENAYSADTAKDLTDTWYAGNVAISTTSSTEAAPTFSNITADKIIGNDGDNKTLTISSSAANHIFKSTGLDVYGGLTTSGSSYLYGTNTFGQTTTKDEIKHCATTLDETGNFTSIGSIKLKNNALSSTTAVTDHSLELGSTANLDGGALHVYPGICTNSQPMLSLYSSGSFTNFSILDAGDTIFQIYNKSIYAKKPLYASDIIYSNGNIYGLEQDGAGTDWTVLDIKYNFKNGSTTEVHTPIKISRHTTGASFTGLGTLCVHGGLRIDNEAASCFDGSITTKGDLTLSVNPATSSTDTGKEHKLTLGSTKPNDCGSIAIYGTSLNSVPVFEVTKTGDVTALSYSATSDRRLKENIVDYIPEKSILDLNIKKFNFINGPKNQIGCIAQELQEICPELVNKNEDGYLSIQENKLVYLLLDEVKKLKKEVENLKN